MKLIEPEKISMEKYSAVAKALSGYLTAEIPVTAIPVSTRELLTYVQNTKAALANVKEAQELLALTGQSDERIDALEKKLNEDLSTVPGNASEISKKEKERLASEYVQKRKAETQNIIKTGSYTDPLVLHRGLKMCEEISKEEVSGYLFGRGYLKGIVNEAVNKQNLRPVQEAMFLLADYVQMFGHDKNSEEFVKWYVSNLQENVRKANQNGISSEIVSTAPGLSGFDGILKHAEVFGKLPGMPINYGTVEVPVVQIQAIDGTITKINQEFLAQKERQPDKSVLEKTLDFETFGNRTEQAILDWLELSAGKTGENSAKYKLASRIYRICHEDLNAATSVVMALRKKEELNLEQPKSLEEVYQILEEIYKEKKHKKGKSRGAELKELVESGVITIKEQVGKGNPIKIIREAHTPEYRKIESIVLEEAKRSAEAEGKNIILLVEQPLEAAADEIYRQRKVVTGEIKDIDENLELGILLGTYAADTVEKCGELGIPAMPMESGDARKRFLLGLDMVQKKAAEIEEKIRQVGGRIGAFELLEEKDLEIIAKITGIDVDHYRNLLSEKTAIGRKDIDRVAERLMLQHHIITSVPTDTNSYRERKMVEVAEKASKMADEIWIIVGAEHGSEESKLLLGLAENNIAYQLIEIDSKKLPMDMEKQGKRYEVRLKAHMAEGEKGGKVI